MSGMSTKKFFSAFSPTSVSVTTSKQARNYGSGMIATRYCTSIRLEFVRWIQELNIISAHACRTDSSLKISIMAGLTDRIDRLEGFHLAVEW